MNRKLFVPPCYQKRLSVIDLPWPLFPFTIFKIIDAIIANLMVALQQSTVHRQGQSMAVPKPASIRKKIFQTVNYCGPMEQQIDIGLRTLNKIFSLSVLLSSSISSLHFCFRLLLFVSVHSPFFYIDIVSSYIVLRTPRSNTYMFNRSCAVPQQSKKYGQSKSSFFSVNTQ